MRPLFFLLAGITVTAKDGARALASSSSRPASDMDLELPLGRCQLIGFEGEVASGPGGSRNIARRTVILSETRCSAEPSSNRCPSGEYCDGSSGKWLCARVVYERRPANTKCPAYVPSFSEPRRWPIDTCLNIEGRWNVMVRTAVARKALRA